MGASLGYQASCLNLAWSDPFTILSAAGMHGAASSRSYARVMIRCSWWTDFDGYSELASLFLAPDARGGGLGRLLSFGRLAFMSQHADRFAPRYMADIRGWTDTAGVSPFWDASHIEIRGLRV